MSSLRSVRTVSGRVEVEAHVHLHAAHGRQVVAFAVEEERVEELARGLHRRRLARAHDAVDVHQRAVAAEVLVGRHGVADVGADGDVVDVEHRDLGEAGIQQRLERAARDVAVAVHGPGELIARLGVDRAVLLVDEVLGDVAAHDVVEGHEDLGDLAFLDQLVDLARRDLLAGLGDDLAGVGVDDVVGRTGAADPLGEELGDPALVLHELEGDRGEVGVHDRFLVHAEGIEERGHGQLPAPVDAREDEVLGVEFEVEPGAAVGNDAAGEEELAGGMRLALVVVEEHARGAVHLGDDDPFRAVHHEGAVRRHERHVAHVDVLFLDVLHRLRAGILVHIEHDEAERDLQRRRIGHVALLAFLDVVLRLFELVLDEFEHRGLVEVLDREDRLEDALDPLAIGGLRAVARVQEEVVGALLDLDEVRHLQHFADLAVILADAFLAEEGRSHG